MRYVKEKRASDASRDRAERGETRMPHARCERRAVNDERRAVAHPAGTPDANADDGRVK
jgi:hypothetical protein